MERRWDYRTGRAYDVSDKELMAEELIHRAKWGKDFKYTCAYIGIGDWKIARAIRETYPVPTAYEGVRKAVDKLIGGRSPYIDDAAVDAVASAWCANMERKAA